MPPSESLAVNRSSTIWGSRLLWSYHYGGNLLLDFTPQQPLHFFLQLPQADKCSQTLRSYAFLSFFLLLYHYRSLRKIPLSLLKSLRVDANLPETNISIYREVVIYCKKNNTCNALYTLFISEEKKKRPNNSRSSYFGSLPNKRDFINKLKLLGLKFSESQKNYIKKLYHRSNRNH
jgi:hypothetical protein